METRGAFGSGKAGSSVDPLAYLRKPSVVFRIGALVSCRGRVCLLAGSRSNKLGCDDHVIHSRGNISIFNFSIKV